MSVAVALVLGAALLAPTTALAVGGDTFVKLANEKRASVGKAPVGFSSLVDTIAVERANAMAKTDSFAHDMAYIGNRLKQLGACYSTYGEIIHYSTHSTFTYERPIEAWWKSTGHRNIMVGDYNAAGGSWARSSATNRAYSVMIFVKLCQAPTSSPSVPVTRIGGADRYVVAAGVSAARFAPGVSVAFVATGERFPDALTGGAAAAKAKAPVLLVRRGHIPDVIKAELARLKPKRIVVLGGTASVSDAVQTALRSYTAGTVTRIAGADRYAVAATISATNFASGTSVAYVATGEKFPDALAGGSGAGRFGGPVLLVRSGGIPNATAAELRRLKPGRIVVLGGPASVSDGVLSGLRPFTTGTVSRIGGADRYAVAVNISRSGYSNAARPTVYVSTGVTFPDGLSGGAVAGGLPGPLLLVSGTTLPTGVADELRRLKPSRVVVLGGTASISDSVMTAIANASR